MPSDKPTPEHTAPELPRPFYDDWPGAAREAARALWHWHLSLWNPRVPAGGDVEAFFEAEQARAEAGAPVQVVPEAVWQAAYGVCEQHRLPRRLLGEQVGAARRLLTAIRFATAADLHAFIQQWSVPHGRLLAHLADAAYSWQIAYVDELARAFFVVGRLVALPRDLEKGWLFIPEADLEQAGVSVAQLQAGEVDEPMRRLLWKQAIRARDAFAQGLPLAGEVGPRPARTLRRWGLGALEVLNELERRDYDLWTEPLQLSPLYRLQVRFQARFGRTTFRTR